MNELLLKKNIEKVNKNIKTVIKVKKQYNQKGGVWSLIPAIGQWIATIVLQILKALKDIILKTLLFTLPRNYKGEINFFDFGGWRHGYLFKYIWWCIKSVFYLMIFVIGGPIITFIGIFLLYKNLSIKMGERSDEKLYQEAMLEKQQEEQNNNTN